VENGEEEIMRVEGHTKRGGRETMWRMERRRRCEWKQKQEEEVGR
jgi:hypothetical protein